MKINNKKIIVSTLALAMGAALAGSISGSVAWYQYSTRATARMAATSAGTSRNLQIATSQLAKNAAGWGWNLSNEQILAASGADNNADGNPDHNDDGNLTPVTPNIADGLPTTFGLPTIRQYATLQQSNGQEYIEFNVYFQSLNADGNKEAGLDVYLTAFDIRTTGGQDITPAVRVAISDGTNKRIAATTEIASQKTEGQLDLNKDGANDRWIFEGDDRVGMAKDGEVWKEVVLEHLDAGDDIPASTYYGTYSAYALSNPIDEGTVPAGDGVDYYKFAASEPGENKTYNEGDYIIYSAGGTGNYATVTNKSLLVGDGQFDYDENSSIEMTDDGSKDGGAYTFAGKTVAKKITTTTGEAVDNTPVNIKIWLEGWHEFGTPASSIWNNNLIGAKFAIDLRFAVEADR